MADETNTASVAVVPAHGLNALFPTTTTDIGREMVLLTWVAFLLAALLLHRLAWKPILRALDHRERKIRDALEGAERAQQQAGAAAGESRRLVDEAAGRARALQEEARLASERAAARIEQEAREKARRLVEDAGRAIDAAQRRATEDLRREAAALAVQISEQMLAERLTPEQRQAYEARVAGRLPS